MKVHGRACQHCDFIINKISFLKVLTYKKYVLRLNKEIWYNAGTTSAILSGFRENIEYEV